MDNAQEMSNDTESLKGDVDESLGVQPDAGVDESPAEKASNEQSSESLSVQKRLKAQKRAHDRELRGMQARIEQLQSQLGGNPNNQNNYSNDSYDGDNGGVDEQIHKAVSYALQHKEMQERQAKQAEQQAHVHRQYGELHKHLDNVADKYDDFDEVVRGQEAPFTDHMRDAALLLPKSGAGSAGEVLYKLGKNPEELKRISKLHPLDQASEMVKLSHALINGGASKGNGNAQPLGNIKNNPVTNSHSITDKTPVSDLRKRMKAGGKTW